MFDISAIVTFRESQLVALINQRLDANAMAYYAAFIQPLGIEILWARHQVQVFNSGWFSSPWKQAVTNSFCLIAVFCKLSLIATLILASVLVFQQLFELGLVSAWSAPSFPDRSNACCAWSFVAREMCSLFPIKSYFWSVGQVCQFSVLFKCVFLSVGKSKILANTLRLLLNTHCFVGHKKTALGRRYES